MSPHLHSFSIFFFFNDTATTEIYTLSLHDALPICLLNASLSAVRRAPVADLQAIGASAFKSATGRSEEHTSELQSLRHLVCRLLLEKKKKIETALMKSSRNSMSVDVAV